MALELRVTAVLQAVANEFVLWCLVGAKGLPCPSQGAANLVPGSFGHFLCFCGKFLNLFFSVVWVSFGVESGVRWVFVVLGFSSISHSFSFL